MTIAYDWLGMNISWTYGCGTARRVYGKTWLFLLLVCGLGWTAFACPYPENIDINDKTVCVGMDSSVTFDIHEGDPAFTCIETNITTVPDPSAGATVIDDGMTVVWSEAGEYSVAITVKITSTDGKIEAIREASVTKTVVVIKVEIDNATSVTYDGLNSGSLICKVEPSEITPSSYAWSATWPTPAYNNPQVTFENPTEKWTKIQNAHWYSTAPSPGSFGSAIYNVYCTVVINGVSVVNKTQASFVVGVYNPGGRCASPRLIGVPFFTHMESNGLFTCTGLTDFHRCDASIVNYYSAASQFYSKVQGHEEQHKKDYDIGYDNHLFYTEGELSAMIVGLTSTNYSSLALMVGSKITEYISGENAEIISTLPEMEDRAYAVSDLIQPYFVYQTNDL